MYRGLVTNQCWLYDNMMAGGWIRQLLHPTLTSSGYHPLPHTPITRFCRGGCQALSLDTSLGLLWHFHDDPWGCHTDCNHRGQNLADYRSVPASCHGNPQRPPFRLPLCGEGRDLTPRSARCDPGWEVRQCVLGLPWWLGRGGLAD